MMPRRFATAAAVALLALLVVACAVRPPYQPGAAPSQRAKLWFVFESDRTLLKTARFDHVPGPLACGAPMRNVQSLATLSDGNPLIGNSGDDGVAIDAGERFKIAALTVPTGPDVACGRVVEVDASPGRDYTVLFVQRGNSCSLRVYEGRHAGSESLAGARAVERPAACA